MFANIYIMYTKIFIFFFLFTPLMSSTLLYQAHCLKWVSYPFRLSAPPEPKFSPWWYRTSSTVGSRCTKPALELHPDLPPRPSRSRTELPASPAPGRPPKADKRTSNTSFQYWGAIGWPAMVLYTWGWGVTRFVRNGTDVFFSFLFCMILWVERLSLSN